MKYLTNVKDFVYDNLKNNELLSEISEKLFLICFAIYISILELDITRFNISWPSNLKKVIFLVLAFASLCRFLKYVVENGISKIRFLIISSVVFFISFCKAKYTFLFFLSCFFVGSIELDYRKILKVFIITIGFILSVTFICALCGSIDNLSWFSNGGNHYSIRSAWGIAYVTDCASIVLFLILAIYVCFKKIPKIFFIFLCLIGMVFSWYICNARNTVLMLGILILFIAYDYICPKGLKNIVSKILPFIPFLCFAVIYIISKEYNSHQEVPFFYILNNLLTTRLQLACNAIEKYPFTLFGNNFGLTGQGGSSIATVTNYSFVDCGYILSMLRYGFIALMVILCGMSLMIKKAYDEGNTRIVDVLLIISVYSMFEHHMTDINYNC